MSNSNQNHKIKTTHIAFFANCISATGTFSEMNFSYRGIFLNKYVYEYPLDQNSSGRHGRSIIKNSLLEDEDSILPS